MVAVSRDHMIITPAGRRHADDLSGKLPTGAWQRLSYGKGAKGDRRNEWAVIGTSRPEI